MAVVVVSPWPSDSVLSEIKDSFATVRPGTNGALAPSAKDRETKAGTYVWRTSGNQGASITFSDKIQFSDSSRAIDVDKVRVQEMLCTRLLRARVSAALEAQGMDIFSVTSVYEQGEGGHADRWLYFEARPGQAVSAVAGVSAELERLETGGVSQEEFIKAREATQRYLRILYLAWQKASGLERGLELLRNFGDGELVRDVDAEQKATWAALRTLTLPDAEKCAARPDTRERRTSVLLTSEDQGVDEATISKARNSPASEGAWIVRPSLGDHFASMPVAPAAIGREVSHAADVATRR